MSISRRDFINTIPLMGIVANQITCQPVQAQEKHQDMIHPPALRPGMTIGLICPGSPIEQKYIDQSCAYLVEHGYNYKLGQHLTEPYLCDMSGMDEQRLQDLNSMIRDKTIDAIFTLRGGYGTHRIIMGIDYAALRRNPKWIVGFSDVTSLHLALFKHAEILSIHGPAFGFDFGSDYHTKFMEMAWWDLLEGRTEDGLLPLHYNHSWKSYTQLETWVSGKATGRLIGGNLSRLAAMAGTAFAIPQEGELILFLEEVDEEAYRVDRFLTQLRESGAFNAVKGVLVGHHLAPKDNLETIPFIESSLKDRLTDLGIPVLAGVPIGHHEYNMAIAHGALVELDASEKTIRYLEQPSS